MKGYTIIPDEFLVYDIDIYETIILGVIFGFSQDGESTFKGSWSYLASKAKCSKAKVSRALPHLVELGLVEKLDVDIRGIRLCEYRVSPIAMGGIRERGGGIRERHNNIEDNIDIENTSSPIVEDVKRSKGFPFKKSLIEMGVSEEVAEAWMAVRKAKKAVNSEIAFNAVKREIAKAGLTPDNAIRIAVERSWCGFQADWLLKDKERKVASKERKESVFEHNIRVFDQMNGTNNHELLYGKKQDIYE